MFPPETSLVPVTIALARFVESNGLLSMFGHYPYWYLGVPYQYLTGPIVPLIQVLLTKVLPQLSLFEVTYVLLILSFFASIIGWGVFVYKIQNSKFKIQSYIIVLLLLLLPWRYLSTLALSEASATISKNLLPFVLLAFWQYYKKRDRRSAVVAVVTLSLLLLINTSVLAIFAVGISALILAFSFRKGRVQKVTKFVKPTLVLVLISLVLTTLWYTPGYWWTVITNPSIGGASGIKVFVRIFDLLKASIPLVLAVMTVYFSGKIKSRLSVFSLTWVFTFLFLTAFRFIGDPDFWQDWSAWLFELEIGLALVISLLVVNIKRAKNSHFPLRRIIAAVILLILPFVITNYVYGLLNKPQLISSFTPQGVESLEKLAQFTDQERTFISGSTVFWAGSTGSPLHQVRGGVDKAATHPFWDHAAFQLREGKSPELARAWLEALGVSYVLVHGSTSLETYHDFRNIDKWQEVGEVVWTDAGDVIISVPSSSVAWVVDLQKLDRAKSPEGGADLNVLKRYLSARKRLVNFEWIDNNQIRLDDVLNSNEGIVIAMSYGSGWKSEGAKLSKDPIGNILLTPNDYTLTNYILRYR